MGVAVGLVVVAVLVAVAAVALRARAGADGGVVLAGGLAAALALAAAGVVFLLVVTDESLDAADLPVLGWLVAHRGPGATEVAETVSLVGGTTVTFSLAVVAAIVLAARGRRVAGAVWVVAAVAGSLVIRLLKLAVERPRPPVATRLAVETTASLPSGHSLMAALGLGLTAAAVVLLARHRAVRVLAVVAAVLAVLAIGASRAYLGVHWTTDVVAGWMLGIALGALAVTVAVVLERRRGGPGGPFGATTATTGREEAVQRPGLSG